MEISSSTLGEYRIMAKLDESQIKEIIDKNNKIIEKQINFDTFVETGTFFGQTIEKMGSVFEHCYSIELDNNLFHRASDKFKNNENISILHGSSVKALPQIFTNFSDKPVIFFLDAHYSHGITARDPLYDPPVLIELDIILKQRFLNGFFNDIIIIDDAGQFGSYKENEDWSNVTVTNIQKILSKFKMKADSYIHNDRMIIHLIGVENKNE